MIAAIMIVLSTSQCLWAEISLSDFWQMRDSLRRQTQALFEDGYDTASFAAVVKNLAPGRIDQEYLEQWHERQWQVQTAYDEFLIKKQELIIETVHTQLQAKVEAYKGKNQEAVFEWFKAMGELYNNWSKHRTMIGLNTGKESARLAHKAKEGEDSPSSQQLQRARKYSFDQYFDDAEVLVKLMKGMTPAKAKKKSVLLSLLKIPFITTALVLGSVSYGLAYPVIRAPLFKLGMFLTRLKAKFNKRFKNIKIYGAENLNLKKKKSEINLIVPSHRSTYGDMNIMAHLGVKDAITFGNAEVVAGEVDHLLVKPLANLYAYVPELVAVGDIRGLKPIKPNQKVIWALERKVSSNIINYGQGFTATMNEILPITNVYVPKLVEPLLAHGFKINVVPVSYEVESSFLFSKKLKLKPEKISAVISKPIPYYVVEYLVYLEMVAKNKLDQFLNMVIRAHWLENIKYHNELTIEEVNERIQCTLDLPGFSLDY